jgi:hypothetical protein
MATNACANVEIKYKGNGVLKQFTFPFTYMKASDVVVAFWDDKTKDYVDEPSTSWKFANATTIEFTNPPQAPTDPKIFNIRIYRATDLSAMEAQFYPGSAIRAEDLNDDFDQLRLAIEEGRCRVSDATYAYLNDHMWSKLRDTITRQDQLNGVWTGDLKDKKIATADAISQRLDPYVQDTTPTPIGLPGKEQTGKLWFDTATLTESYWDANAKAWVNISNTGPAGPAGTVAVGTTTTGPAGSNAAVTNNGTATAAVLDFVIPRGADGAPGAAGAPGPQGPAGPPGSGANLTFNATAPITVNRVGTDPATITYGFDVTPLATLP